MHGSYGDIESLLPDTATWEADGCLSLAGRSVAGLAEAFGTPLYVYDVATIRGCCAAYRAGCAGYPGEAQLVYAAKAFAAVGLLRLLAAEGLGVDCVSGGELFLAWCAGVPPECLVFHGNNKSEEELALALRLGVGRIVVDSLDELELLARLVTDPSEPVRVLLRLNPGVEPHDTHAYRRTGQLDSKFGLPIATGDAARAVARCLELWPAIALLGYHIHIGSQIFDLAPYRSAIERAYDFAAEMARIHGAIPQEFSPGGGFGVAYTVEDRPVEVAAAAATVAGWVADAARARGLPLPRLVLEPGRSLVARAGVAVYRVGTVKRIPGVRTYVAVDGGMADNIRPALYGARYQVVPACWSDRPPERVRLVGKYCESGDVLIDEAELPSPQRGDLLVIPVAGAYCLAMASNYNAALRPTVVAVEDGDVMVWQRRERLDDLLAREVSGCFSGRDVEFRRFS
ncbi:MAG: diaminopimelate decarboxylase [Thermomicrobium sp.]|nr:diaminopimelate decarboxylase [Thermomicrobium sp.]